MEHCYGMENRDESLWIRVRLQANKGDIVVGLCYRPPSQHEEVDEAFLKHLKDTSGSQTLLLVGNLSSVTSVEKP